MTALCQNCGSVLKEGAHFCEQCGAPVGSSYIQSAAPPAAPPPNYGPLPRLNSSNPAYIPPPPPPTVSKKPSTCLVAALIAAGLFVLLLVLGACLWFFLLRPASSTRSFNAQPTPDQRQEALAQTQQALENTIRQLTSQAPLPGAPLPPAPQQPDENQAAPTLPPAAAPSPQPAAPAPSVVYANVSFSPPKSVASGGSGETVLAYSTSETGQPPGVVHPAYVHISLNGYAFSNLETMQKPELMVYPAQEYGAMDELAKQAVSELAALLQNKPAAPTGDMPFMPLWPAAQMMHTGVKYLNFQNGSGVRYLTQYGQAEFPIINTNLFYTFQGLAGGGKYYINFILPVSNPILPDDEKTIIGPDFNKWMENYQAYKADILQKLAARPDTSFTPSLADLDAMVQTLNVK